MKVKISEIIKLKNSLAEINSVPLEKIKFLNDKGVYISPKLISDFKFTDFIATGFYKEGFVKE
jgi:hypothetical protein